MTADALDTFEELQRKTQHVPRLSLTDLARTSQWRKDLPACGLIEVMDRTDTAGWLVSDGYMNDLLNLVQDLSNEQEQQQIKAMLDAREAYQDWQSGDALLSSSLERFEARKGQLKAAVRGD